MNEPQSGYLCLTRGVDEGIWIGKDVFLKVLKIKSMNQVVIGISAPKSTQIDRSEIREKPDFKFDKGNV